MRSYTQDLTLMGTIVAVAPEAGQFTLRCRSGDEFVVSVSRDTLCSPVRNLDNINTDRVPDPPEFQWDDPTSIVNKYVELGRLVALEGVRIEHEGTARFDARTIHLTHSRVDRHLFEEPHWWLAQITRLADQWLDALFDDRRSYQAEDFAKLYYTNLNIVGLPTDDNVQEMATLSRLIYGLSSAYLLTGADRYLVAAQAGVTFQRMSFRSLSHDGKYCFWATGRRRRRYVTELIVPSENPDDAGTMPLYEQIYALAGLAQYYRITAEWEVLDDIRRTVATINDFYLDDKSKNDQFPGHGGYFSHLDAATMRPDVEALGDNQSRKNWNSIGDHLPAYLVNLVLALDPLPLGAGPELTGFRDTCLRMLEETSNLIVEKFPDPDPDVPYVNERFHADWTPDQSWRWQQDRAVAGHNLKIAWNLTRVANFYLSKGRDDDAKRLLNLATQLGTALAVTGIDQFRGGCFDAVERHPPAGSPVQFAWMNTKDFWQQEQALLAFLVLYGATADKAYLGLARETSFFWNLFHLDHQNNGIFFRVNDNGLPIIRGQYGQKGGHSVSGYHAFELNFLAHIYIRTYLANMYQENFCLFFRPDKDAQWQRSINVLPDFFAPNDVEIAAITVNGRNRPNFDRNQFQVPLEEDEFGGTVVVEFRPRRRSA